MKRSIASWLLLALLLGLGGCQTMPVAVVAARTPGQVDTWQPLFVGVEYRFIATDQPRPLRIHAVRVDLEAPGIGFVVTPSNGAAALETNSQVATDFLAEHGCQVAINASPFGPVTTVSGQPQNVKGLSASGGQVYSPPHADRGVLWIDRAGRAHVTPPPIPLDQVVHGVGGFGMILIDGRITTDDAALHPRTAAGVSGDGRYLLLMVVDGRQTGFSEGMTQRELALWMRDIGAAHAVNLDGGGSTAMAIMHDEGRPRLVNRPIHLGLPGNQRPNANHLGIHARPLETP